MKKKDKRKIRTIIEDAFLQVRPKAKISSSTDIHRLNITLTEYDQALANINETLGISLTRFFGGQDKYKTIRDIVMDAKKAIQKKREKQKKVNTKFSTFSVSSG